MNTVGIYLNFLGNTETVFEFYKSIFGGEFKMLQRFDSIPDADKMSADDRNKIMHICLPLTEHVELMGTDALQNQGHTITMGNNINISINAISEAEADKLYNGLAVNGVVEMPLQKTFWNAYFGMLTDQYGIKWMVNYDYPTE